MKPFNIFIEKRGSQFYIKISGRITESSIFPPLKGPGITKIEVDFNEVEGINSGGTRQFIRWVRNYPYQVPVSYLNCPKIVIDQVNLVASFLNKFTRIDSFYVPYYCKPCNARKYILFSRDREYPNGNLKKPNIPCETCRQLMDIDVMEKKYFSFL